MNENGSIQQNNESLDRAVLEIIDQVRKNGDRSTH